VMESRVKLMLALGGAGVITGICDGVCASWAGVQAGFPIWGGQVAVKLECSSRGVQVGVW
jgi:hypothetical protein